MSHLTNDGKPCARPDGHVSKHVFCDHPECNGKHSRHSREWGKCSRSELCPGTQQRDQLRERDRRRKSRRAKYVYAILVDECSLKIGCSTFSYADQQSEIRRKFADRGLGTALSVQMIWHNRGDEGLEIFLQWRAGRLWEQLVKGARHSEWFDVTGVSSDRIKALLMHWRKQADELSREPFDACYLGTGES